MTRAEPTKSVKANVRGSTYERFKEFCEENNETQVTVHGLLLEWFMGLDKTTRSLLFNRLSEDDQIGVTKMVLDRMAEKPSAEAARLAGKAGEARQQTLRKTRRSGA